MSRALIFDFNGVIADDERPHVECFKKALSEFGLSLSTEEYYGDYSGMDERMCAALLLSARDGTSDPRIVNEITRRKMELFRAHTARHRPALFPGVAEFVKSAVHRFRLAIASGGRRRQIDEALAGTLIEHDFDMIVAAEDCLIGKPDPAIYRMTLTRLNARRPVRPALLPSDCLVFEDSVAGIRAARGAGMKVIGVATTYPAEKLREADAVLPTFVGTDPDGVVRLIATMG
ncbi:MAG TPA: HAD family phosphatase [Nitrospira sp.]|nr:HAD family phosphatase [Nitrospira sp.]